MDPHAHGFVANHSIKLLGLHFSQLVKLSNTQISLIQQQYLQNNSSEEMEAIYQKDDLNLTLGLPGRDDKSCSSTLKNNNKRCLSEKSSEEQKDSSAPPTKAQVVGWPPVRSFRKNIITEQTKSDMFVKVSMDGAPFLRKIDLKFYKNYMDLVKALENMFKCRIGVFAGNSNGPENALTYEDKDGDWMLVGDVPWDMFITSCKRLRIMKGSEAKGLGAL